jgi:hypothetical protein
LKTTIWSLVARREMLHGLLLIKQLILNTPRNLTFLAIQNTSYIIGGTR